MAAKQNFRTAFNGFNREDVVHYIEYLNNKYTTEINRLTSQLEESNSKLEQLQSQPMAENSCAEQEDTESKTDTQPTQDSTEQSNRIQELEQALEASQKENAELEALLETATAELDAATAQQAQIQSRASEELEAYRRAERTEREAKERAQQIYLHANGVLADATVKVDEAAVEIGALTDHVLSQLQQLQNAVSGSTQALQDASAALSTIRPTPEEM